ncbi:UNVERIFIED_CONTAM: hypothetical protein HDU68_002938, partial [Siphonaria sp. JEL0065]
IDRSSVDGKFHCRCGAKYVPTVAILGHTRKCTKPAISVADEEDVGIVAAKRAETLFELAIPPDVSVSTAGACISFNELAAINSGSSMEEVVAQPVAGCSRKPFIFCMPMYYGETILNTEEDFWLSYDLYRFVK